MTVLCKRLFSGLMVLMMLLLLAPGVLAEEETRLQVTLSGLYARKDGTYQSVAAACDFDVYQDGQKVGTLRVTPEGDESILLPGVGDVSLVPVAGSYPQELPLSEYGYGLKVAQGRLNIAPIELYANAGLFAVVGDYQADYAVLNAAGETVMTFRSDMEGGYKLEQAIPAGTYILRMTSAAGPLWEDQQFDIVTYTGKDSVIKLRRPATKAAEPTATQAPTATPAVTPAPTPVPTPVPTPEAAPVPVNGKLTVYVQGEMVSAACVVTAGEAVIAQGVLSDTASIAVENLPQGEYLITLTLADNVVLTGLNGNALFQRGTAQWMASVAAEQESVYTVEMTRTGSLTVAFDKVEGAQVAVTGEQESFEITPDADGAYVQQNVLPGTYTVSVQLLAGRYDFDAAHWAMTENGDGTCTASMTFGVSSDSVTELPRISRITIGSVEGKVVDIDGDAMKGVQVTVYDAQGRIAAETQTNQDGVWTIGELPYGEYIAQYTDDDRAIPATGFTLSDENVDARLSASAAKPAKVRVRAFLDENNNGSRGKNESSVKNVEVALVDNNGVVVDTGLTAKDGYVTLSAPEGEYILRVTVPEDYGFAKAGDGTKAFEENFLAESAQRTQESRAIRLTTGDTAEVGVGVLPMAVVTGTVWNDLNADGIWQDDEPGIPGVRMMLTGGKDKISMETYTDENGVYSFHQIKKGTYKVICHVPDAYVFTGKAKAELEKISRMTTEKDRAGEDQLSLEYGERHENHNIGMMEGAIIEGVCFLDANYNGVYEKEGLV